MYRVTIIMITLTISIVALSGCATNPNAADPTDPYEKTNRSIYKFNDSLDRNIMLPIAQGYENVTPAPFRTSVTNFFENVTYLNVITNDLLQGKVGQFVKDSGRFVVNSTIGIGGLFDPAAEIGLDQHEEDLGQTFGVWGAGEGAYLVLPFLGPNSTRDAPDVVTSILLNPFTYLSSTISIPLAFVNIVNTRANLIDASEFVDQAALDPYTFVREGYRQRREFLLYDGNPPLDDFEEFIEGDGEDEGVLKVF